MKAIIGQKLGMSRIFDENGNVIPVTLIVAKDNVVAQIKTQDKDNYQAIQIALPEEKKIKKPQAGHLAKAKIKSRHLKEMLVDSIDGINIADKLDVSQFKTDELVAVTAVSKGKGFAGTVKRHHFHLGPKTHGSDNYRRPGSIGGAYPQRVIKGRRMAGHLGADQTTVKNLRVINIDTDNKVLMLKGAVPGANKSFVFIWSKK